MKFTFEDETFDVEVLLSGQVVVELEGFPATIDVVWTSEGARYSVTEDEVAATAEEAFRVACRSLSTRRAQFRRKKAVEDQARNELVKYVTGLAAAKA